MADRTMRERIARRLAALTISGFDEAELTVGGGVAQLANERWQSWLDDADAILDELREPTEAMSAAGNVVEATALHNASSVWQAMIDTAKQGG